MFLGNENIISIGVLPRYSFSDRSLLARDAITLEPNFMTWLSGILSQLGKYCNRSLLFNTIKYATWTQRDSYYEMMV